MMDLAEARLQGHREGSLSSVKMLMRADHSSDVIDHPLVAMQFDTASPVNETGMIIDYEVPLRLMVQVDDHDFARGYLVCMNLVNTVMSAIVTNHLTGEPDWILEHSDGRDYPLRAGPIDMPAPMRSRQNILVARATVSARIQTTI